MRLFTPIVTAAVWIGALGAALPTNSVMAQASPGAADRVSDADLEELLAPIALYPDPLLANMLAASCYPEELAEAVRGGGRVSTDWEPAVRAIAKIPDALQMLTQYPEWTAALGEAFITQSQDVTSAVQRLRARAYANGSLTTTAEQVVQTEGDIIIIQPAEPEVIYVPTYEPSVVYVDDPYDDYAAGVIGFGVGITAGLIIANNIDCDWWGGGCCWGCGHGDVDIDINVDRDTINNIKNNGNAWKANRNKLSPELREGRTTALNNYRGVGSGGASAAQIPRRSSNASPIAQRPAPRPSQVSRPDLPARPPSQTMQRPDSMQRPGSAAGRPSIPPASQRPPAAGSRDSGFSAPASRSSRPSAYGGGGHQRSALCGAASRGGGGRGGRRG